MQSWIKNNTCEGGGHTYCVKNKKYPHSNTLIFFFNVKRNQCKHNQVSINKVNILKEQKLKNYSTPEKNCSAEKISYIGDVNTVGYMYTRRAMVLLQLLLLGTSYLRVQHIAYLLCQCAKMNLHEISKDPNNCARMVLGTSSLLMSVVFKWTYHIGAHIHKSHTQFVKENFNE